jgi:hypothetical protein
MRTTTSSYEVQLGDLVVAAFDEAKGLGARAGDLVSRAVTDVLVRTGNARVLRALEAGPRNYGRAARDRHAAS